MSQITDEAKRKFLTVYIPDTHSVTISRYGRGNLKIGLDGVYTYSRLPGDPRFAALGGHSHDTPSGTCPGATSECLAICYASRPVAERGAVYEMWAKNSDSDDVPPIPDDCKLLRIHVSGDFTSVDYINDWCLRLAERPDVRAWAYTRSWRVPKLLPALERLRAMPNIQLFASMDQSHTDEPPKGWRRAWIDGDTRAGQPLNLVAHHRGSERMREHNFATNDGTMTYVCPEETKRRESCEKCNYCILGQRGDVTFLRH
jgi:hypothetical protein